MRAAGSHDIVAAFHEVQSSGLAGTRGEFESTAQYQARLASWQVRGATKQYVFVVEQDDDSYGFQYDADAKEMHLTVGSEYLVSDRVELRTLYKTLGTYFGTNAFGVKKLITRMVEDTYYIKLAPPSPFQLFRKDSYEILQPRTFVWAMEPAPARAIKASLRIAVVGTVPLPEATEETGLREATIDSPRQVLIHSRTLPFSLEQLRVVNSRTGATVLSFGPENDQRAKAGLSSEDLDFGNGISASGGASKGSEIRSGDVAGLGVDVALAGPGLTQPVPLYRTEPEYSEEARKAKYQGTVVVYVEVDPAGRPRNLKVVRSLGLGLDEKALEAVEKWKFRPGYKDGKPVTASITVEVNFRLL